MPVRYCTQCGSKHEYTLKPAIFCGSCGEVLDVKAAAEVKEKKIITVDAEEFHEGVSKKPLDPTIEKIRQKRLERQKTFIGGDETDEGEDEDNAIEQTVINSCIFPHSASPAKGTTP